MKSELEALLSDIEACEKRLKGAQASLREKQHDYLMAAGFAIEFSGNPLFCDCIYTIDGETFRDVDSAIKYAEIVMFYNDLHNRRNN